MHTLEARAGRQRWRRRAVYTGSSTEARNSASNIGSSTTPRPINTDTKIETATAIATTRHAMSDSCTSSFEAWSVLIAARA